MVPEIAEYSVNKASAAASIEPSIGSCSFTAALAASKFPACEVSRIGLSWILGAGTAHEGITRKGM